MMSEEEFEVKEEEQWYDQRDLEQGKTVYILHTYYYKENNAIMALYLPSNRHFNLHLYLLTSIKGNVIWSHCFICETFILHSDRTIHMFEQKCRYL